MGCLNLPVIAERHLPLLEQALAELPLSLCEAAQPSRLHEGREGRRLLGDRRSDGAMPSPAPSPAPATLR